MSQGGEGKVVHHDQLKLSYVPFQLDELVCPSREIGEFQVVDVEPQQEGTLEQGLPDLGKIYHLPTVMVMTNKLKTVLGTRTLKEEDGVAIV